MLNSEKMLASLQAKDLAHAEKYFQKALDNDPNEILLELAEYLESIGFYPQAKLIYNKLKEIYPEVNINLAQIVAEDGDMEEAFLYLNAISENSEEYLSALLVMADLYQMEGLTDVARDKLLLASKLSSEPLVIFGLAELEYELEHYKDAIDYYAQLDNRHILGMTGISTYHRIGRSYANLGKFEVAVEFLEKALEIEYDDVIAFDLGVILHDQKEYQKANLYFKQLEAMNCDFPGYEYVYALSLKAENKLEEALRLVQQGLAKNEFDSQLFLLASQLAYETHDRKLSESYLLSAYELAEDVEEVLLRLTTLYLEEERYEDVIALELEDIDLVLTKWNIAKAYQGLDQEEEALTIYREISDDLSENPEFLQDYAYILREFGHRNEAKEIIERYLTMVPDDMNMISFKEEL
ncbi:tetratricopeptide repeat protein [Streptococcus sp. S784/96/1]|uniref:tetratricopeptide repeat protein n=1 Tax=Streptococcus sp. S784/96/1 TaxID=2653499 RepID=UPI00138761F8|nr:tetratricopeptide repeat protein [Streptococcus sp. S784/96/1]